MRTDTTDGAAPQTPKVGDGATVYGWSDSRAYTVVAVAPSSKRCTLQRDKATLLNRANSSEPDALHFEPGGFCGHTSGTQRYSYERDPDGTVCTASLTKRGWRVGGQRGSKVTIGRRDEHYDFNF